MRIGEKEILVIGDRVLIKPDNPEGRTKVGLYLPQTVTEKEPVQSGVVVATGPGTPVPSFGTDDSEPWQDSSEPQLKYVPIQVSVGDYALFLKKEAVEIQYNKEAYVVVPQSAILLLVRGKEEKDPLGSELESPLQEDF